MSELMEVVRSYLRGIEDGNLEAVMACYAPEAEQIEWPNRLKAHGDRRTKDRLADDFEKGKGLLSGQSYDVLHHVEAPDSVVVEVLWRGCLAVPLGKLAAGDEMVAHSAIAFTFRDGLILSQRNYDCFEEF